MVGPSHEVTTLQWVILSACTCLALVRLVTYAPEESTRVNLPKSHVMHRYARPPYRGALWRLWRRLVHYEHWAHVLFVMWLYPVKA